MRAFHSLNSYLPPLSTASNSILAISTLPALSSNLHSTLSPGFIWPTPEGVPVSIKSPVWKEGKRLGTYVAMQGSREEKRALYRDEI